MIVLEIMKNTHSPPNNCIPRSAKIRMKRNKRKSRETIDLMLLRREITRFRSDDQYLSDITQNRIILEKIESQEKNKVSQEVISSKYNSGPL